jgi:hypothetical protein
MEEHVDQDENAGGDAQKPRDNILAHTDFSLFEMQNPQRFGSGEIGGVCDT